LIQVDRKLQMSQLTSKLGSRGDVVQLYGTTPPRSGSSPDLIMSAAERLVARVRGLPLDGFVVYDLQDESSRTAAPRPFPFVPTVDSRGYSKLLGELTGKSAVCYKCIARLNEAEWLSWLTGPSRDYGIEVLSLVGRPTSQGAPFSLTLSRAYQLASVHEARFVLGGVAIAERHEGERSESRRMLAKAELGCDFFVSQAVYSVDATIRMISDYARDCRERGVPPRRVILTFAPCARPRTIAFMRWLGIALPHETEQAIVTAPAPLSKSIDICRENLRQILTYVAEDLPIGINAESVSINRDEIDASIDLFLALTETVQSQVGGRYDAQA
jgi:5,10-methylenetetrahydrofolate reductase